MIFSKVDMAVVRMEKAGEIIIATAGEGGSHRGGSMGMDGNGKEPDLEKLFPQTSEMPYAPEQFLSPVCETHRAPTPKPTRTVVKIWIPAPFL